MPLQGHVLLDDAKSLCRRGCRSGDDDAGDSIALDKLAGSVHRPVKVRFRSMSRRRWRALGTSLIRPAFKSASMLICLPGMASGVNRAATSATVQLPW